MFENYFQDLFLSGLVDISTELPAYCVSYVSEMVSLFVPRILNTSSFSCAVCWHANIVADINELSLPKTCQMDFPDPNDLLNFKLSICPDEVIWFNCSYCSYL